MIEELRKRYPFPTDKPGVQQNFEKEMPAGWCCGQNRKLFAQLCKPDTRVIIDGGSWMGLSAWWFLKLAPSATVVCIDHWRGSREHQKQADTLATLYETFCANLWDFRDRVVPMWTDSVTGMQEVSALGVVPDIVYIDWSHEADAVHRDLSAALDLFPRSEIIGDDWTWASVREGIARVVAERDIEIVDYTTCWQVKR